MAFTAPIFRGPGGGSSDSGGFKLPLGRIVMWGAIVVIALVVVSVAGCGIKVVHTGHRGIKTTFGKVVSESLPEDLGPADLAVRCFGRRREDVGPGGGAHVVRAARAAA